MSDEKIEEKFEIKLDAEPPKLAWIQIPIKQYAENTEDGVALLHGKLREAEARLARVIMLMRQEQAKRTAIKPGVIGPNGQPMVVN